MICPPYNRIIDLASLRMSSTRLDSFRDLFETLLAKVEGSMSFSRNTRPSAFETIFCVTTTISLSFRHTFCFSATSQIMLPRSSPDLMIGMPLMPMIRTSEFKFSMGSSLCPFQNSSSDVTSTLGAIYDFNILLSAK